MLLPVRLGWPSQALSAGRSDAVRDVRDLNAPSPCPPHPRQGPCPLGRGKSCWSSSCLCRVAAKGRRKPADTSVGRSQLHLWWKPSEVARAARGTKLCPGICKPRRPAARSMAGLHFLHIAKPSIPEIPRQAQCKGTRSRRHLPSLNASICGPLTPQSLSPCQKAVT